MAGLGRTDGIGPPDPRTIRDGSKNSENARHAHRPDPRHPWCPSARASSAPRTPETLASRGDLATWTGPSGDPAAVRDQFADLAPVCKTILGAEHPDPLDSGNLATWTGRAGDPADKAEIFCRLGLKLTYHPGTSEHRERHPGSKPDIGQL